MAAYVDYTYYSGTFLGTAIAEANFPRLALRASAVIDQLTFERAAPIVTATTDTATIEKIKLATCTVAEEIQTQETNGNTDNITSENVGSYSVSYGAKSQSAMTNEEKQAKVAKLYLGNTGLMFPGFAENEN